MKLLFDQNLSMHLIGLLGNEFPDSSHVRLVGLERATDREIWDYARNHDFAIVSKDSDFRDLAHRLGPPPQAVHIAIGNASTTDIHAALKARYMEIASFGTSDDALIVVTRWGEPDIEVEA